MKGRHIVGGLTIAALGLLAVRTASIQLLQNTGALFLALVLEGAPFLLLGSFVASVVQEFIPAWFIHRVTKRLCLAGIPVAVFSGFVFPICECAIVPATRRLRDKGMNLALTMTFLVSVPLLNPVVIASTVTAFSDRPKLIVTRFAAGFVVALLVGLIFWIAEKRGYSTHSGTRPGVDETESATYSLGQRFGRLVEHTAVEFVEVFGYFAAGALLSALLKAVIPPEVFLLFRGNPLLSIPAMIVVAYVLSVCSEADAFLGRSFIPLVGEPAVLAFLVFGPMLDLKNTLLLRRAFRGREIALLAAVLIFSVSAVGVVYGQIEKPTF
jgi:hypothetical protein